jgi:hypothetical protein
MYSEYREDAMVCTRILPLIVDDHCQLSDISSNWQMILNVGVLVCLMS